MKYKPKKYITITVNVHMTHLPFAGFCGEAGGVDVEQ